MTSEELLKTIRSFQESRVLLTGVEFDLFANIEGGATAGEAAARIKADRRATEMLLNALVALGVLEKRGGVYHNTAVAVEQLTGDSRLALMHQVHLWTRWSTLTECVREGTSVTRDQPCTLESIEAFIAAMHRNASARAPEVVRIVDASKVRWMLDVGGGSGAYSIAFARANPELEAELLDRAEVVPIASRHIKAANLAGRVRLRSGDLRHDDLGSGFDLVFISAICHMLSPDENRDLLLRAAGALKPGGRIVIQDFVLNAEKTAPPFAAMFSLNMLVGTERGACYSEPEYRAWLEEAGMHDITRVDLQGSALMMGRK